MITAEQTKLMVEELNKFDHEKMKVLKWEFYPNLSIWSL